jgi:hypothetical protein
LKGAYCKELILAQTTSLQGTYQLVCQHEDSLQGKFPTAKVEQIFKTWPQQIKNQNIVLPLNPKPPDVWNPSCRNKAGQSISYDTVTKHIST